MWQMLALGAFILTVESASAATAISGQEVTSPEGGGRPVGALSAKIADAVTAWTKCRYSALLPLAQTARSDADIVDESFARCAPYEAATLKEWKVGYPKTAEADVQELRKRMRQTALTKVSEVRGGGQVTGRASGGWGKCVGEALPSTIAQAASKEAIVDSILDGCSGEMDRERATLAQKIGPAAASAQIEQTRGYIRNSALEMLEQRRSN